jgi:hypothetical protein
MNRPTRTFLIHLLLLILSLQAFAADQMDEIDYRPSTSLTIASMVETGDREGDQPASPAPSCKNVLSQHQVCTWAGLPVTAPARGPVAAPFRFSIEAARFSSLTPAPPKRPPLA